jgi:hypothetical protein
MCTEMNNNVVMINNGIANVLHYVSALWAIVVVVCYDPWLRGLLHNITG